MKREYAEFFAEYEALQHMIKTPNADEFPNYIYSSSSGSSSDQFNYATDVAKMYRQILIDERDRDYQRILWLDGGSKVKEYQLCTVTYGTTPAPFLALRVLEQLVKDKGHGFPLAASVLRENVYVDDFLFGAEDIPLLRQTRNQVCDLLKRDGFILRKWASNQPKLLSDIPPENHGLAGDKILALNDNITVLGITWNPTRDSFQFSIALAIPTTKRAVLSTIAKLFDPLGWVTPVTLAAEVFMQQLWRLKLQWDDIIPEQIGYDADTAHLESHGFADASTVAYAAVVYLRVTSLSGMIVTTLLAGKSRVSPLKPMTIPRLELSAAILLSRLIEFVGNSLNLTLLTVPCYCWTDSTVTLTCLSRHPSQLKTFIAHRIADVQARLPDAAWAHVSTNDNPADYASRRLLGNQLNSCEKWWRGPSWLTLSSSE
ncbi:uncharacterized protein LOC105840666 [Monomorium pharaonis]|uniref:uncharacterized protein LOC105840666 n=1 Tax=Monomorium pharaonis TaxID=307658 RepID=UPI00063FB99C|nr:uncharacterized protein LOC105840666 [Monomorium pharaonis]